MKKDEEVMPYPFDFIPKSDICLGIHKMDISRKLAKALIIKFLKRERVFYEVMIECMLYHPRLKTVDDVLNNMTESNTYLYDSLFSSARMFSWNMAQRYHIGNEDGFWIRLKDKWHAAIDNNWHIKIL